MGKYLSLFTVLAIILSAFSPRPQLVQAGAQPWQNKVDAWVMHHAQEGETEFLVWLHPQADLSGAAALQTKLQKGRYVTERLQQVAARTQAPVLAALQALGATYRPYWVTNAIWVRGGLNVVEAMARRADVAHLYANPRVKLSAPVEVQFEDNAHPTAIEWNLLKVNADDVWAAGYTGQGVVIGGADTGYDWDHPALITPYRGWNGSAADHNYNWHDATGGSPATPVDPYGHGTHTMGIMVGDDGGSNQIGMAPGARWIGCRNMDASGYGTPERYIECYQWFMAPTDLSGQNPDVSLAPDVINNSWGCTASEGCTDPEALHSTVQAVRAAGIVTVHSAGNYGSACSTILEPAAIYAESFTVGATTSSDALASYSGRGPVTVDGSNRLKPDISAPGSGVRSCVPGTGYGSMSGTSMAAPHVAGLVGLMLSAQPSLDGEVEQIETLIEQSALPIDSTACGSSGTPNNLYGWGRIDAWAVFQTHGLEIAKSASSDHVVPGGLLTYSLTVTHTALVSPTFDLVISDTLPAQTSLVSATQPYSLNGDAVRWEFDSLAAFATQTVTLTVQVDPQADGMILNLDYAARSREAALVTGDPVETMVEAYALSVGKSAPAQTLPGSVLTYTLALTNPTLYAPVHHLVLTDSLPANTTFVAATPPYTFTSDTARWDFARLEPGESQVVTLTVRVPLTFTGTISNQAYALTSDEIGPLTGAPVTTEIYALALAKTASAARLLPGGLLTYTLTVTNLHPTSAVHNLMLLDTVPVSATFVAASGVYTLTGGAVAWQLSSLEAHNTWQVWLTIRLPEKTGSVTNSLYWVESDETGPHFGPAVTTLILRRLYLPLVRR